MNPFHIFSALLVGITSPVLSASGLPVQMPPLGVDQQTIVSGATSMPSALGEMGMSSDGSMQVPPEFHMGPPGATIRDLQDHLRSSPPTQQDLMRMSPEQIRFLQQIQANTPGTAPIVAPSGNSQEGVLNTTSSLEDDDALELRHNEERASRLKSRAKKLEKDLRVYDKAATKLQAKGFALPTDCVTLVSASKAALTALKSATATSELDDLDEAIKNTMDLPLCMKYVQDLSGLPSRLKQIAMNIKLRSKNADLTQAKALYAEIDAQIPKIKAGVSMDELRDFFDSVYELGRASMQTLPGARPLIPAQNPPSSLLPVEIQTGSVFDSVRSILYRKFFGIQLQ